MAWLQASRSEETWSARDSAQPEPVPADERAEVVALGNRVLARLVLRPPVGLAVAEAVPEALALARPRVARLAAPCIGLQRGRHTAVVVAVGVHDHRGRQPHARPAGLTRIADAESGHRKDAGRQLEELAHLLDVVPDHADGAAAETERRRGGDEALQHEPRVDG